MGLTLLEEELKDKRKNSKSSAKTEELLLVHSIQRNTQSAVDVLNDLLNYDKVEGGNLSLELELCDVWQLVTSTVSEFKLSASSKGIDLVEKIDEDDAPALARVVADPIRFVQVLRNLISNAVKFTKKKGTITVQARWVEPQIGKMGKEQDMTLHKGGHVLLARNGHLELSVKDSGAGMTKTQLEKLFQSPGVQFNANKLQGGGGTGLGLYISKGIMEQHGGTLTANSEGLEKGTTFTLTIPMYMEANSVALPAKRRPSLADSTGTLDQDHSSSSDIWLGADEEEGASSSLYILAVDDSLSNLKLMKRLLERHGHTVVSAMDGQEALEAFNQSISESKPFDVICMDYQMPVKDGPTAVEEMRGLGCDSFIVGITGNVLPDDVAFFKSKGANAVLGKPFRIAELEQLQVEHSIVARSSRQKQSKIEIQMGGSCSLLGS